MWMQLVQSMVCLCMNSIWTQLMTNLGESLVRVVTSSDAKNTIKV